MVQFESKVFYYFLVSFLGLILAINFLTLIAYGNLVALISISIFGTVFFAVVNKKSWTNTALYLWSIILIIAGRSKILATILKLIDYRFFDGATRLQEIVWPVVAIRSSYLT